MNISHLRFHFHAISQVNSELSNVTESMLVRHYLVEAEYLRGGILHQID